MVCICFSNDKFELNVLGRYRFQKLDPSRNAFYEGIEERKQTVDAGVEVRLHGGWGSLNANFLTDTLDRHRGQSAEVTYRYDFDRGSLTFSPFVSWSWNDAKLTNYYYGVSEAEERLPDRPAYTPGESQWIGLGLNTTWWISNRIQFFGNFGFGGVDTAVAESPLVEEDTGSPPRPCQRPKNPGWRKTGSDPSPTRSYSPRSPATEIRQGHRQDGPEAPLPLR